MVLDLGRFTPRSELAPGTLWVAEQLPGIVARGDMTRELALGYWPSYNIPFFPEVGLMLRCAHLVISKPAFHAPAKMGYWIGCQLWAWRQSAIGSRSN